MSQIQNFYKAKITRNMSATTGDFNVSVKPVPTTGWLVLSPNNPTLREIVKYSATGTNIYGDFITISNLSDRGVGGTSAQTHTIGEDIRMNLNAEYWGEMQQTIDDIVASGSPNASISQKGLVQQATPNELKNYTEFGSTGASLFVSPKDMKQFLPDSILGIYPGSMFDGYSDQVECPSFSYGQFWSSQSDYGPIYKNMSTTDWTGVDSLTGFVTIGDYTYVSGYDTGTGPYTQKVLRYTHSDYFASPVEMTYSGAKGLINSNNIANMTSDGTYFYFTMEAGNSSSSFILAKFSLSGTVFTYISSTTYGSDVVGSFAVKADGTVFIQTSGSGTFKEYSSDGTLLKTYTYYLYPSGHKFFNIKDVIYSGKSVSSVTHLVKTSL